MWLNNRACAALDAGRDPAAALAVADEAIGLRPDVPAIQHTRARALLAVGRLDDAIAVLDAMRAGGELAPQLEAERCRELATAWDRKGQADYASDYRARARLVARGRGHPVLLRRVPAAAGSARECIDCGSVMIGRLDTEQELLRWTQLSMRPEDGGIRARRVTSIDLPSPSLGHDAVSRTGVARPLGAPLRSLLDDQPILAEQGYR